MNADSAGTPPAGLQIETGKVCPIAGSGPDAATPAVDTWNEVTPGLFNFLADIDGVSGVPAAQATGMTIADQLVHIGLSWKTYQESLPLGTRFGVNYSNGTASNLTDFTELGPLTTSNVVQAYAVKHNPFAYFKNVQQGDSPENSLKNVVGFDGPRGLYADLATGNVPSFSFLVPNQCNDQHGRGNADAFCGFDPGLAPGNATVGTTAGLNPGLIQQGDVTIERLVEAIKASRVWDEGRNAIVIVWDENDYSGLLSSGAFPQQNQNNVVLTVELNREGENGVKSNRFYTSFSLLKSIEAALGLPCLNHACDPNVALMSDLFGGH